MTTSLNLSNQIYCKLHIIQHLGIQRPPRKWLMVCRSSVFAHKPLRSSHQRWFIFRSITYRHRILAARNSVSVSRKLPNSQRLPAVWLTPVWELDVTKAPCRFGRDIFGAQEMWRLVISECKFSSSLEKLLSGAGRREEWHKRARKCNQPTDMLLQV